MTEEPSASTSHLEVVFDADDPTGQLRAAMRSRHPHPADDGLTDATDPVLADLRRRVVDPVVASLFSPAEVDEVSVRWGALPAGGDVWVRVVAEGELFEHLALYGGSDPADPVARLDAAAQLADRLEDFVSETRFGWGEQRISRYDLPPD